MGILFGNLPTSAYNGKGLACDDSWHYCFENPEDWLIFTKHLQYTYIIRTV